MRGVRFVRVPVCLVGLALVFGGLSSGCDGGSKDAQMVKPDTPPEVTGKDSMDFYKSQMKGGAAAKKK